MRLFLHASTKVSCVGFMIWFPSGRLPQHRKAVLRNDINLSITCPKGKYHAARRIAPKAYHCEGNITAQAISLRNNDFFGDPAGYCVPVGKRRKQAKDKQTNVMRLFGQKHSYRGPLGILCTRGEKAQTSKRVSIIAPDNVISKAQFATRRLPISSCPRQAR